MKTIGIFGLGIQVEYLDNKYNLNGSCFVSGGNHLSRVKVDNIGDVITNYLKVSENEKELKLEKFKVTFAGFDEVNNPLFEEEVVGKNILNKDTLNYSEDLILAEILVGCKPSSRLMVLKDFIFRSLYIKNKSMYKIISDLKITSKHLQEIETANLYDLVLVNFLSLEKLINANKLRLIETNLSDPDFVVNNGGKKLHKVVELPKFALTFISENQLDGCLNSFKSLSEVIDGNDLKIYLNFINNLKHVFGDLGKKASKENSINKFTERLENLISNRDYRLVDLLSYLLKASYYGEFTTITFPLNEIELLDDYINLCTTFDLEYDKYPQRLKKTHDVAIRNVESMKLTSSRGTLFQLATESYSHLCYENDKYKVIVPKTIGNLVEEGSVLHHCVGGYVNRIISGTSKILFIREKTDVGKPFVTVELSKTSKVSQIRGNLNKQPNSEVMQFVNEWLKNL